MPVHDADALAAQGAALELCEERAADCEERVQAEQLAAQSRRLEQLRRSDFHHRLRMRAPILARRVEAVDASLGAVE
ncbi:unnamed protein product, partial [Prorocentrum cordatum]